MKIDFILAHFGGFTSFSVEPALSTFLRFFPDAHVTLYTDDKNFGYPDIIHEIVEVVPPYPRSHKRYGWRCSDLYRAEALLASKGDIAIYSDSDMYFYSDKLKYAPALTRKFGICLAASPRILVKTDTLTGTDSDGVLDDTGGYGFAYNASPIFFDTSSQRGREYLEEWVRLMRIAPVRGPVVAYRAAANTGIVPYLLPFQWSLTKKHVGIGDEVVLHLGRTPEIVDFYLKKKPLWLVKAGMAFRLLKDWIKAKRRGLKKKCKELFWKK